MNKDLCSNLVMHQLYGFRRVTKTSERASGTMTDAGRRGHFVISEKKKKQVLLPVVVRWPPSVVIRPTLHITV
jgi:hypothetical protein